jgi:hypothetical protein
MNEEGHPYQLLWQRLSSIVAQWILPLVLMLSIRSQGRKTLRSLLRVSMWRRMTLPDKGGLRTRLNSFLYMEKSQQTIW